MSAASVASGISAAITSLIEWLVHLYAWHRRINVVVAYPVLGTAVAGTPEYVVPPPNDDLVGALIIPNVD